MAEWLKAHAWKACLGETLTWVRIPLSPPASLNRREFRPPLPRNARNMPVFRDSSSANRNAENRLLRSKGELSRLFSGRHLRSPVSRGGLGERNAITCSGFGHGGLTFLSVQEPCSWLPRSPFLDREDEAP